MTLEKTHNSKYRRSTQLTEAPRSLFPVTSGHHLSVTNDSSNNGLRLSRSSSPSGACEIGNHLLWTRLCASKKAIAAISARSCVVETRETLSRNKKSVL